MGQKFFHLFLFFLLLWSAPSHVRAEPDSLKMLASGGVGGWLNTTRPLTVDDFKGRLVLLDFWTYGCINCIQIVPDLEFLEQKYGDKLLIVGVHSAKFKGEQGNDRILSAAKRFGLKHPVINDSDFAIWKKFGVEAWPTQILLNENGDQISKYEGEGHRGDLDQDIAKALSATPDLKPMGSVAALMAVEKSASILSFPSKIGHVFSEKYGGQLILIADSGHHRLVGITPDGTIKVTIGSGVRGFTDGTLDTATFNNPHGFSEDSNHVYVADTGNHAIRAVDLEKGTVTTIAGTGARGRILNEEKVAKTTALASPWDIISNQNQSLSGAGYIIANAGTHQLLFLTLDGKLKPFAGNGREGIVDGNSLDSELAQPSGIVNSGNGGFYFVDAESSALRSVAGQEVKTLIGTGLFDFGLMDGKYPEAQLQHPQGLDFDGTDRIYVADTYNNAIRLYDLQENELSTLPIKGQTLSEPGDLLFSDGKLYVTDTNNNRIIIVEKDKDAYELTIKQ